MFNNSLKTLSGLLMEDENVASYVLEGEYFNRYMITPKQENFDVAGALEETLHRLLDYNFTPDDIYEITGMRQREEGEDEYRNVIEIDLGYCLFENILCIHQLQDVYDLAVKEWQPYIIRNTTPGNITTAVVIAASEEIALRKMMAEYSNTPGWYAEVLEPGDGIKILS